MTPTLPVLYERAQPLFDAFKTMPAEAALPDADLITVANRLAYHKLTNVADWCVSVANWGGPALSTTHAYLASIAYNDSLTHRNARDVLSTSST